jgi:hypothetical protein
MGFRNHVGIGLSYWPASLLATQFQTRFLESIPRPISGLKFSTLFTTPARSKDKKEGKKSPFKGTVSRDGFGFL